MYSVQFEDHELSEYERFLRDLECQRSPDFGDMLVLIDNMVNRWGFRKHQFKDAGSPRDSVCSLRYDKGPLRLYCCRWSKALVIAGYGGVKQTRTYE